MHSLSPIRMIQFAGGVLTLAAVFYASGSGGLHSSAGDARPAGTASSHINEQTAPAHALVAYLGAATLLEPDHSPPASLQSSESRALSPQFTMLKFGLRLLDQLALQAGAELAPRRKVVGTACSGGGTMIRGGGSGGVGGTAAANGHSRASRWAGMDELTVVFDRCTEGASRYDGVLSISALQVDSDPSQATRRVSATFRLQSLSVESYRQPDATLDGTFSMQATYVSSPVPVTHLQMSSPSLSLASSSAASTLSRFSARVTLDARDNTFRSSLDGQLTDSALPGPIDFDTPEPLQGVSGAYPSSGTLRVRASDGSTMRLMVESTASVVIDVDSDANGSFESSRTLGWSQLMAR